MAISNYIMLCAHNMNKFYFFLLRSLQVRLDKPVSEPESPQSGGVERNNSHQSPRVVGGGGVAPLPPNIVLPPTASLPPPPPAAAVAVSSQVTSSPLLVISNIGLHFLHIEGPLVHVLLVLTNGFIHHVIQVFFMYGNFGY